MRWSLVIVTLLISTGLFIFGTDLEHLKIISFEKIQNCSKQLKSIKKYSK